MFFNKSKKAEQEPNNLILPSFLANTPKDIRKRQEKKVLKWVLRIAKVLIYMFFFGIGLYGCFQTYSDYWTASSTTIGNGLEIGFNPYNNPFHTDNPEFVLIYSGSGPFYPFSDFTMKYGPFYAWFVWPFSQILLYFLYATRSWPVGLNALLGIFIILLIIRVITFAVSVNSMLAAERMSEIQGKIAEINAKYKDAKDPQSRQKKQLETQELYRKHNVRPFAAFEQIFITLPIFLIIYRVVTILRPLKFMAIFDAWDLTQTPISQIFSHFTTTGWPYIFFLLIVIPAQFLSQLVPRWLAKKRSRQATTVGAKNNQAMKRTKMFNTIISVVMAIVAAVSASGIGVYWFFNALFTMTQSLIIHKIIMDRRAKGVTVESKLTKLGIE